MENYIQLLQEGNKILNVKLPEIYINGIYPRSKEVINIANSSNANFIKRLKDPNRKFIKDWKYKGSIATHKLAYTKDGNKFIVYPEVQEINGELHDFTNPIYKHSKWDSLDTAYKNKDYLIFDNESDAKYFTQSYKNYYPKFDYQDESSKFSLEPVITPDYEYNLFLNTLPDNLRLTPEDKYRMHFAWNMSGKPKTLQDAKFIFYDDKKNSYDASSVLYDPSKDEYNFLKPKDHSTIQYELDWYNSEDGKEFRKDYKLINPKGNYYKYVRRKIK